MLAREIQKPKHRLCFGLLLSRTIFGSWQGSEEPFKIIYLFTREEPLLVLHDVIFLSLCQ